MPNADRKPTNPEVPRRRFQRTAAAARKYRRLFAATSILAVLLGVAVLAFILQDNRERIILGVGKAGVADTAIADTSRLGMIRSAARDHGEVRRELPGGAASYYGDELAGRPTASGESFDPGRLTAAHRTLPFGTRLRVTNVRNGRSVVVRVNDRGPYSGDRVIDLSYSAARQIGLLSRGEGRVRLEVLK